MLETEITSISRKGKNDMEIFSELPDNHAGKNGEASGTIEGTVTNISTGFSYKFIDPWIWRDTQQGTLRFHGVVDDPEAPGKRLSVGLVLADAEQVSGDFKWSDSEIKHLGLGKYDPPIDFKATSGRVIFRRREDDSIHGRLVFTTAYIGVDSYLVDVNYDIGAP